MSEPPRRLKRPAKRVRIADAPGKVFAVASQEVAAAAVVAPASAQRKPAAAAAAAEDNDDGRDSVSEAGDADADAGADVDDEGKRERKTPLLPSAPSPRPHEQTVLQLTLEARDRRTQADNKFLAWADPIVARIPLEVPPPAPGFADHRDVLKRAFRSDNGARNAVFDYICRVSRAVYPSFNDAEAGQSDNRHSAMMIALTTLSPSFQTPFLKDYIIMDGLAAFYGIPSFRRALEAQCDVAELTRFMQSLWPRSQSSLRGLDVADFGKRRVKNATPTFGYDLYTYVVVMRKAYGGAFSPQVGQVPLGLVPRLTDAPTAPVPSHSTPAAP